MLPCPSAVLDYVHCSPYSCVVLLDALWMLEGLLQVTETFILRLLLFYVVVGSSSSSSCNSIIVIDFFR